MEDLNKNQIILLTLLISFVTSIATGIMTTSLLQEAPIEVTRNINSIVEKTIQTVTTPATVLSSPGQKEVTTVVVKEEDSIISSIDKNIKSIVRINEKDGLTGNYIFYGIGLVVNKDGLIAADRKTINNTSAYYATMNDGVVFQVILSGIEKQTNFIIFKAQVPKAAEKNTNLALVVGKSNYTFVPATFADAEPKLGQTLIGLGGDTSNAVAVGRVVSLEMKDMTVGTTTTKYLSSINTDISSKDLVNGSPVFNLSGDIVGVKLSLNESRSFTPIAVLKKEIVALTAEPNKTP